MGGATRVQRRGNARHPGPLWYLCHVPIESADASLVQAASEVFKDAWWKRRSPTKKR